MMEKKLEVSIPVSVLISKMHDLKFKIIDKMEDDELDKLLAEPDFAWGFTIQLAKMVVELEKEKRHGKT